MEKFLIECESIDKFVEYVQKQYYYYHHKNDCIQQLLGAVRTSIRKTKLEKLEKLY